MLPEVVASVGDDLNSGSQNPGKMSFCYQHTLLDSERDSIWISRSLWESGERVPYSGDGREVMLLVRAINCLIVSHKLLACSSPLLASMLLEAKN